MMRRDGRIALYEVIGKKSRKDKSGFFRPLRRNKMDKEGSVEQDNQHPVESLDLHWRSKPRLLQLNAGRVEISLTYQNAVIFGLVFLLLIVVVFRLGQLTRADVAAKEVSVVGQKLNLDSMSLKSIEEVPAGISLREAVPETARQVETIKMVKPMGDHRIVIQQFQLMADLVPVQQYFAKYRIETEIEKRGMWYFLLTKDRYENPNKQGTDGFWAKTRIMEVGANYKAPAGYDSFGSKPFQTAYGEKIK